MCTELAILQTLTNYVKATQFLNDLKHIFAISVL